MSRPSLRRPPPSESEAPPSAGRYDQEFLYHLYRGSELLRDDSIDEAKAELERAIKLQPRDVEGQSLLGVVYFRLGLYPRAIDIYEQLEASVPKEPTPRLNLALCYLKTGLLERARDKLEEVLRLDPKHKRAWGYLGLVFQRFGDFEKARVAFERAERPKLAQRMKALVEDAAEAAEADIAELSPPPARHSSAPSSFRPSLMPEVPKAAAAPDITMPPQRSAAPAFEGPLSSVALPLHRIAQHSELVFAEQPRIVRHRSGSVLARIDTSLALRSDYVSALCHDSSPFATLSLRRRTGGRASEELLGGSARPLVSVIGAGRAILHPRADEELWLAEVDADHFYLLEERLVAFEPSVNYETGPLDPLRGDSPIAVRLSGSGTVVASTSKELQSMQVSNDRPAFVRAALVTGWTGRVLPRMIPSVEAPAGLDAMVGFSGQGMVLLDLGRQHPPSSRPND